MGVLDRVRGIAPLDARYDLVAFPHLYIETSRKLASRVERIEVVLEFVFGAVDRMFFGTESESINGHIASRPF